MGKTAAGAIWLNEEQLSAYDYWQFWRNTEDADVERFLKLYTTLPLAEVAKLAALQGAEINEAKKTLATEATALLHGREKAEAAAETARQTFEQGASAEGLPTVELAQAELAGGIGVLTAFVQAGLVKSNGEARRQIQGGGLRVNDQPVADEKTLLTAADVAADGTHQAVARQEEARAAEAGLRRRQASTACSSWACLSPRFQPSTVSDPSMVPGAGSARPTCSKRARFIGRRPRPSCRLVAPLHLRIERRHLEDVAENARRQHRQRIDDDLGPDPSRLEWRTSCRRCPRIWGR